jgi:hypothetical protein
LGAISASVMLPTWLVVLGDLGQGLFERGLGLLVLDDLADRASFPPRAWRTAAAGAGAGWAMAAAAVRPMAAPAIAASRVLRMGCPSRLCDAAWRARLAVGK